MTTFDPKIVINLLINEFGVLKVEPNEEEVNVAKYIATLIKEKLEDLVSTESYRSLVFVDDFDDDEDDEDYELNSDDDSESDEDEDEDEERSVTSSQGSQYVPSPQKSSWPSFTLDQMREVLNFRNSGQKPKSFKQIKHRFRRIANE